jgi:hypothetical protein
MPSVAGQVKDVVIFIDYYTGWRVLLQEFLMKFT